eukprot:358989-Chlamydomonas_euryale.AAC.4
MCCPCQHPPPCHTCQGLSTLFPPGSAPPCALRSAAPGRRRGQVSAPRPCTCTVGSDVQCRSQAHGTASSLSSSMKIDRCMMYLAPDTSPYSADHSPPTATARSHCVTEV